MTRDETNLIAFDKILDHIKRVTKMLEEIHEEVAIVMCNFPELPRTEDQPLDEPLSWKDDTDGETGCDGCGGKILDQDGVNQCSNCEH